MFRGMSTVFFGQKIAVLEGFGGLLAAPFKSNPNLVRIDGSGLGRQGTKMAIFDRKTRAT